MPVGTEPIVAKTQLTTSREPKLATSGNPSTIGSAAFQDALIIIGVCWAVIIGLVFSLRSHII